MGLSLWPEERKEHRFDDEPEFHHYEYDGYIVATTSRAVGLGSSSCVVEIWLPSSQVQSIEYEEGGDCEEIIVGRKIRSVEIPEWLASQKNL